MELFSTSLAGASRVNADALFISADHSVFAVVDGASGSFDKHAAGQACRAALANCPYAAGTQPPLAYIGVCFDQVNTRLTVQCQRDGQLSFGTMTLAVLDVSGLAVGAVGDSPAFLINHTGAHKLVQPRRLYMRAVEKRTITAEQAERAIATLPSVLQSFFDSFLPVIVLDVTTTTCPIYPGDVLLMCTDGLSDWVKAEEMAVLLRAPGPLAPACDRMMLLMQERCPAEKRDDATLLAIRM